MDDRDALARAEGLHNKFIVERWDGRHRPGEKHDGCQYLVLDLTHDVHAQAAVAAYADAAEDDRPAFVDDLRRTYLAITSRPDVGDLRERVARALFAWNTGATPYFVITSEHGRDVPADDPYLPIADAVLATLPAPVVSGEDVESVKADIAGWLKRNHTHTPSDGCRTCEWRAQEIGHLVDLWALHLGADAPEAGERA